MGLNYAVFARFRDEATAREVLRTLDPGVDAKEQIVVRVCQGKRGAETIAYALMNSGRSAESDLRRGLSIGLILGGVLGTAVGGTLFYLFEMPTGIGTFLGLMMGTMIGALMSGIVGAGLINHNLKPLVENAQAGHALVTVLTKSRQHQRQTLDHLRSRCEESAVNR